MCTGSYGQSQQYLTFIAVNEIPTFYQLRNWAAIAQTNVNINIFQIRGQYVYDMMEIYQFYFLSISISYFVSNLTLRLFIKSKAIKFLTRGHLNELIILNVYKIGKHLYVQWILVSSMLRNNQHLFILLCSTPTVSR